jgi:cytochrome c nitrite reductase small subunit
VKPSASRAGQTTVLMLLVAGVIGLAGGIGLFAFHYGEGTAYLSDDPEACVNCHVMQDHFDSWINNSHQPVTVCNSCHLPDGPISKWVSKADNGFFHSVAFTLRNHPDPIRIKPRNARIVQNNCVGCHADFVHEMLPDRREGSVGCVHCHREVGHAAWR